MDALQLLLERALREADKVVVVELSHGRNGSFWSVITIFRFILLLPREVVHFFVIWIIYASHEIIIIVILDITGAAVLGTHISNC